MTKCLFNALLFTVMEIVFPALLHQKSGSVTLTLFWAKFCGCISHYGSQIKTFCWHSSRALSRAQSPDGNPALRDGDGSAGCAILASLALKCFGIKEQSCREALPSWCTTAPSPVPRNRVVTLPPSWWEAVPLDFLRGVKCRQRGEVDYRDGETCCYSPKKVGKNSWWKNSLSQEEVDEEGKST